MLAVEVPTSSATRAAPWRSIAARAASRKPSPCRPSQASRLLRQSRAACAAGSGACSRPSTRPIAQASGVAVKSLRRSPLRRACRPSACAARPWPSAEVAVNAVMASGGIRLGTRQRRGGVGRKYDTPTLRHLAPAHASVRARYMLGWRPRQRRSRVPANIARVARRALVAGRVVMDPIDKSDTGPRGEERIDQVRAFLTDLQDRICGALELADGGARFVEDAWRRDGAVESSA